jgi:hypothetical protein
MVFVPEGQHDSSQARSAWHHQEISLVPAGRLKPLASVSTTKIRGTWRFFSSGVLGPMVPGMRSMLGRQVDPIAVSNESRVSLAIAVAVLPDLLSESVNRNSGAIRMLLSFPAAGVSPRRFALNTSATAKPDKWVVNASILASMTGCYRPAINTFIEARKQKIDELNAAHGLGPGHNRATARTHPNAIPELVKRFKEEVLGQPF